MLKNNETWTNIKRTWRYAKKNKKLLFGYFIFSLFLSLIGAAIPVITAKIVLSITAEKFHELVIVASIVFAVEIIRNLFRLFSSRFSQRFFRNTLLDIQISIAQATVELESEVIENNSSGTFIDRLNKDASDIAIIFGRVSAFITDFLSNIGVLSAVFIISRQMFLYFIICLVILFLINKIQWTLVFKRDKEYRKLHEKNTGVITELVRGLKDIKLLNANENFLNKIYLKLKNANDKRYKMLDIERKYNFLSNSLRDLFSLIFIFLGIFLVNGNLLTVANFVVLFMYKDKVFNVLMITSRLTEEFKKFNLSTSRVFEILENEKYDKEKFGNKHLKQIKGDFEFKNVEFYYSNKVPVLKNLNLKVNANETIAFVGKSGSGKTTIFSLLTKLYKAQKGEITLDGENINNLTKDSIRGNISIITQNPYIFNFSIKENLSLVKEDSTDEEMVNACKKACIHDFIETLPDKYDTVVGEGGITLSGGQRQRVAIARALIKNTEIIMLDEATSALDNETQEKVQDAINNMKNDYTIMVIAHRLSTVINSDKIIVVDEGEIVGQGTHEELLKENKHYKKLYKSELNKE